MLKRRRTVQHLWNRFMAAMLFVMGAALGAAAPSESQEARLSRAEASQIETGAQVKRQLSQPLDVRFDGAGVDGPEGQPVLTSAIPLHSGRPEGTPRGTSPRAARLTSPRGRDGDARAPPV
jgi:hypothetical protein